MANTLLSVFRSCSSLHSSSRINKFGLVPLFSHKIRCLYAKAALGIDGFEEQREKTKSQMSNISEKFKEKMLEYSAEDSRNMIFTEDLKNMVHISENDKDVEIVVKMLKRYNSQNKTLRFGSYIFGPVVMRMFYIHNKPDLALQCFMSDEFSGIFDQFNTYQILMDLLYENEKYNEILKVTDVIKDKQFQGNKFPRNVVVLALAACYKLNSKESFEYALKLWTELQDVGHYPMRRASTFCAALSLNQGRPDVALEIISTCRNQNYTTVRNIKIAALCDIGRIDDIIPILKKVISDDSPKDHIDTFNKDILDKVKTFIQASDNPELTLEINRLEQIFQREGHISETKLEEQLCSEIQKPPQFSNRNSEQRPFQDRRMGRPFQRQRTYNRPGLSELV